MSQLSVFDFRYILFSSSNFFHVYTVNLFLFGKFSYYFEYIRKSQAFFKYLFESNSFSTRINEDQEYKIWSLHLSFQTLSAYRTKKCGINQGGMKASVAREFFLDNCKIKHVYSSEKHHFNYSKVLVRVVSLT